MSHIRNIYCIGRNYAQHAAELGNEVPKSPIVFTKPTHSLIPLEGSRIMIPKGKGEVHYELEIVLRIGEGYISGMGADEAVDAITLGLDLTLRDVQSQLKAKGQPWLAAKGFKQSAPIGPWKPFEGTEAVCQSKFQLLRNGVAVQNGCAKDMLFNFDQLICYIDQNFGLESGDIIFTGTPAGVAALTEGDQLKAVWNGETWGSCTIV